MASDNVEPPSPTPDSLVARCQQGDRRAFQELFRQHRADVARVVFRMMGAAPDLEDVVQEVFLQVFRSIGEFKGTAKFTTWLHRVSVNVVLMHRRAKKSRPSLSETLPVHLCTEEHAPDEDAARRERVRAFYGILDQLPEKKRTVFVLHEMEGLSPKEIAEVVDAPALTVRTRLFYARRDIIRLLRETPSLQGLADIMVRSDATDPTEQEDPA